MAYLDASLLRTFVACVRSGSISRAALSLNRTQPAVSQQLRRLEDITGEALLRRTPSGVLITPAGERLLPYAERILALSAEGLKMARREEPFSGRCGIGLMEDFATPSFSAALADFAARHPSAALEIVMLPGPAMHEAFQSGRVQLVLGDCSYLDRRPSWSIRLPLVWAAAPELKLKRDPLPLLLFSEPCRWREPVLRAVDRAGYPWRVAFESTNLSGILAAVSAGIGVAALIPASIGAGMITPNEAQGLPKLPVVEISLVRSRAAEGDKLVDAVEQLLRTLV
jgi:DNA-binding transcriptional LysR family regulator